MAVTTRRSNGTAPDVGELETRLARAEHIITLLLRILNRDIVQHRGGRTSATYAQIMVNEQRLATHEEVADLEAWLTDHFGG
jgi:hypothetical protein